MEAELSRILAKKVNNYLAKGKTMTKEEVKAQNKLLTSFYKYIQTGKVSQIKDIPTKYNEIIK